jgi:hypothetical protein
MKSLARTLLKVSHSVSLKPLGNIDYRGFSTTSRRQEIRDKEESKVVETSSTELCETTDLQDDLDLNKPGPADK